MAKKKIGEILVEMGVIDQMQLSSALAHHRQWGMPLAQALIEKKFCTEQQVMDALSRQAGLRLFDLDAFPLNAQLAKILPERAAEQYRAVPLKVEGKRSEILVVAIAAPGSIQSVDALQAVTGKQKVVPYLAADAAIARAIGRMYRGEVAEQTMTPYEIARVHREVELELDNNSGQPPAAPASPAAPPPSATSPVAQVTPLGLKLSPHCAGLILEAAKRHGITEQAVIERILETWAARTKGQ